MAYQRLSSEEKKWRLFQRTLDRVPASEWQMLGLLGETDLYPNSLYKLHVHPGDSSRWWRATKEVAPMTTNPVAYQDRLKPEMALPPERVIRGSATQLLQLHGWDERAGINRVIDEFKRRLQQSK